MKVSAVVCVCMILSAPAAAPAQMPARVEFNRDIRPILSENCFQCHGPDKGKRKADLRLDTQEGLFKNLGDYFTVVAKKPGDSELYARITAQDEAERMPPPQSGRQLTARQIAVVKQWIDEGAHYQGHWAYLPPARPPVPAAQAPNFTRNDIDAFILTKLREQGLTPSPAADRATLIRRLSFDLVGLPPTPAEVQAFVADQTPEAYEKVVDRLLASPHFGERMAQYWLDLVRFADTNGYHGDNHQDIDLFRDYVIEAFNTNKPFDRFTTEQLAGDLLPNPTLTDKIASGYNRLLMTTREGGAQAKEYLAKYSADRVRNVSTVWMGATVGCAECHDHKYDPFTTKDFYSLAAFFADIQEVAVGEQPQTPIPTPAQAAQLQQFDEQLAAQRKILDTPTPELAAAQADWGQALKTRKLEWSVLRPESAASQGGATLKTLEDGSILATEANPEKDVFTLVFRSDLKGITAVRLEILPDNTLPQKGPGRASNGNFVLNEFAVRAGDKPLEWSSVTATHSQKDFPIVNAADGKPETGWAILDQVGKPNQAVFEAKADVGDGSPMTLAVALQFNYGSQHALGRIRLSATTAARPVRAGGENGLPQPIAEVLALEPAQRSDKQQQDLAVYYRGIAPQLEPTRKALAALQQQKDALGKTVRTTLVSLSGPPRPIRILPRGNWLDDSGEVVNPAPPGFLPQAASQARATRKDLANWLTSADNPLVSRVFVNRLWKLTFGQGIVKTLDDFGSQGTWPTHPELLDWLALDFREHGWDVKRTLKLLVMSGAYQQSSLASGELRQHDPYNIWLARQGRFRLDAEMVRDNALAASGLLSPKIGGPSVKPYQPAGYWSHLNFPMREYQNDKGESLYRRGLYTYWARTFLHPSLKAFDAPTREECTVERPRSNTPLQALVLLNDPIYVEAARVLAERVLHEAGKDFSEQVRFAYLLALSRPPRSHELPLLEALYRKHLEQYQADKPAAQELLHIGDHPAPADLDPAELAAWTSVARVIFNLHETITRN
jgi:mono/diheme cytochrome c family protein